MKPHIPSLFHGLFFCQSLLALLSASFPLVAQEATNQASVAVERPPVDLHDIVRFGQDVTLGANETAPHVVVIFANATIDGTVNGDVVVVGGQAQINGEVEGTLVVVMGDATLGPKAVVEAEAVVVGGRILADPTAKINGQQVELAFLRIPGFREIRHWLAHGLLLARPLPPQSVALWGIAVLFLLLYLLLNLVFPRLVQLSVTALENRPVASFGLGLLTLVLFGPLVFLLLISMVGLITIPFLLCALVGCLLLGKAAVLRYLGHQFGHQTGLTFLQAPFPALLFGGILVLVLYMVPVLGFLVWGITTPLGLGAVVCAGMGLLERRQKTPPPLPPPNPSNPISPPPSLSLDVSAAPVIGDVNAFIRAGFWARLAATVLDFLLVGFVVLLLGFDSPGSFCLIWTAYHIALWTWRATTIGGIILGLKIVRLDGQPVTVAVALVRSLASYLSALIFFIGFFWAGWDGERQSWHDKIAGTTIVRMPKGMPLILV